MAHYLPFFVSFVPSPSRVDLINSQGKILQLADKLEHPLSLNSSSSIGKTLAEMEREIILQRLEEAEWKIEGPNGAA